MKIDVNLHHYRLDYIKPDFTFVMMKKCIILFLSLCMFLPLLSAQTNDIDLEGVFTGKYRLDDLRNLSWRPQYQQYSYLNEHDLLLVDAAAGTERVLLSLEQLKTISGKTDLKRIPAFQWVTPHELFFPSLQIILVQQDSSWDIVSGLPKHAIDQSLAKRLFVTKEEQGQVFVQSEKNGYEKILLCTDTGKYIVFGETVHRSEWGIDEGQYISPNANFIAFYRMDEGEVEAYPLVNINTPMATVEPMKYPMAGKTSHRVTVGIFDVNEAVSSGKPAFHYVKTDIEDGEFLTNVTFSPDEKRLYITHLNRAQNHAKLIEYDVASGNKVKILIEEHDDRYVEPDTRMMFLKNGNFIWQSDRDGWNHLYLYDKNGKLLKQITSGNWEVIKTLVLDQKEETLFFITNKDMPTDRYVYAVNLKNGSLRNLTPEPGTHSPRFSDDGAYFIDYFQSLTVPRKISLNSSDGKRKQQLLESRNPYEDCRLGESSIFSIRNNSRDELYCRLILPPNFDSAKSYPCLIYVYGGPHSQMVTNTFMSGGAFLYYLSQQDYVIFTLDNRGTAYRGAEFEKCIHRCLGVLEMEDQLCGVDYLKRLPYIDSTRLGLDGWSYGGFLILSLLSTYPDVFKAASCGGPVVDWRKYEVMYGERYMDTPEENPEGYAQADILPKVKNIRSHLLVMHGAQDHTVVWQHSLQLLQQAVEEGVELDYFVYPAHDHNVRGIERVHLWKKLEKFHRMYLK